MRILLLLLSLVISYIVGSIPTAYIFGKLLKGIDIREHGSGNVGATNVFRVIGKVPGIIVLIIDFLKGFLAVTIIPLVLELSYPGVFRGAIYFITLIGGAVIAGHIWTIFLKFKGGKGVATTAGVMIALAPLVFLSCLIIWAVIFFIWRYVSLASIVASCALPIMALVFGRSLSFIIFCCILCAVGVYGHRSNIKRLIQGTEKKLI